jgi:hypothetical protein
MMAVFVDTAKVLHIRNDLSEKSAASIFRVEMGKDSTQLGQLGRARK